MAVNDQEPRGKIESITVSRAVTVNLGQFQNQKAEVTVCYRPESDEPFDVALAQASALCATALTVEVERIIAPLPPQMVEYWREAFHLDSAEPSA